MPKVYSFITFAIGALAFVQPSFATEQIAAFAAAAPVIEKELKSQGFDAEQVNAISMVGMSYAITEMCEPPNSGVDDGIAKLFAENAKMPVNLLKKEAKKYGKFIVSVVGEDPRSIMELCPK